MNVVTYVSCNKIKDIKEYTIGITSIPSMDFNMNSIPSIEKLINRGVNIIGAACIGGKLCKVTEHSVIQIPTYKEFTSYQDDVKSENSNVSIVKALNANNMYYIIIKNNECTYNISSKDSKKCVEDSNVKYVVCTYRGQEVKYVGKKSNFTFYIESAHMYNKIQADKVATYLKNTSVDNWYALTSDEALKEDNSRKHIC